jgi:hypothetical protein
MATVMVPVSELACAVRSVARDWTLSMRPKAIVWVVLAREQVILTLDSDCAKGEGGGWGRTDIDDVLDLAKDSGNGLADDGDGVEEASLADEDVEEGLVGADELLQFQSTNDCGIWELIAGVSYLAESVEDGVAVSAGRDGVHVLHLGDGNCGRRDDVGESHDDLLQCAVSFVCINYPAMRYYLQGRDPGR